MFIWPCFPCTPGVYLCLMEYGRIVFASIILLACSVSAASKPHVVVFGKWTTIRCQADDADETMDVKVRALYVDGKTKEFTVGPPHDVTEHIFVVQRMFRVNVSLPQESGPTHWRWEKGGWFLVDRASGRVQQVTLPEFDPYYSRTNWFRDYVAYCGTSDDGQKAFAMIVQLGKRRPLLKKGLAENGGESCPAPAWQRNPVRVTFTTKEDPKLTFVVKGRSVGVTNEDDSDGEE
jgi:hypothetical protein